MSLEAIFPKETIIARLESTEKDELFEELVEIIHTAVPQMNRKEALDSLTERESKMTTGIMHNVAIPHALIPSMDKTIGAIGISEQGIDYDSLDKAPVYLVFMIIGAQGETEQHIQVLKELAGVLQIPGFVDRMRQCKTPSEISNFLRNSEESVSE
ncbi:MAG: PTS sugar transporter subunit IIA [Treponema sp.]|nr:PTS sugar transporter subunit IIA [Treponema sp.]